MVGELTATKASFRAADLDAEGGILAAWASGDASIELDLVAASIQGDQRQLRWTDVQGPQGLAFPVDEGNRDDVSIDRDATHVAASIWDENHRIVIHLLDATVHAEVGAFDAVSLPDVTPCGGILVPDDDCIQRYEAGDMFIETTPTQGPLVLSTARSSNFNVLIEGDLRIQIVGIDLDGDALLRSTFSQSNVAAAGDYGAKESVERILDLHVTDARLQLSAPSFDGQLGWAMPQQDVQPYGAVQLSNAIGRYAGARHDGDSLVVDEGTVRMAGAPDAVAIQVHSPSNGLAGSPAGAIPAGVATTAFAALGAAVVVGLLAWGLVAAVRMRRLSMEDVESALEAQQYRRAARMAGHVARRFPDDDAPAIARAVALSKIGRDDAVVAHIERRLGRRDPADGVLHYILGIAQLALDRRDEAFKNLKEAVRRTPSLEAEVSDRLGDASSGSSPIYV